MCCKNYIEFYLVANSAAMIGQFFPTDMQDEWHNWVQV